MKIVTMPSVDCILGDKLTAFAPHTTGIPYNIDKELEIIKQMYDISCLFDEFNGKLEQLEQGLYINTDFDIWSLLSNYLDNNIKNC